MDGDFEVLTLRGGWHPAQLYYGTRAPITASTDALAGLMSAWDADGSATHLVVIEGPEAIPEAGCTLAFGLGLGGFDMDDDGRPIGRPLADVLGLARALQTDGARLLALGRAQGLDLSGLLGAPGFFLARSADVARAELWLGAGVLAPTPGVEATPQWGGYVTGRRLAAVAAPAVSVDVTLPDAGAGSLFVVA